MPAPDQAAPCAALPELRSGLGPFPSLTLRPGDLLTVALPDGQTVEIDARDPSDVVVHHIESAGDVYFEIGPMPEPDVPHPSLSAAERNPSMR